MVHVAGDPGFIAWANQVDATHVTAYLPEAYGAAGDGVTNDTAAMLSCITAASADVGGKVLLTAGKTYLISTITATLSDFVIEGYGAIIQSSLPVATTSPVLWFYGSNIRIRGVKFTYSTSLNIDTDGAQIYTNGSNASTVRVGYPSVSQFVDNITVEDCSFSNCRNTAVYIMGASRVRCLNNTVTEAGQGIFVGDIQGDLMIKGNSIRRCLDDMIAVVSDSAMAGESKRVVVTGNTGYQGYTQGIDLTGVDGAVVADNVIEMTWGAGILAYQYTGAGPTDPCYRLVVRGNVVRSAGRYFGAGQYQTAAGSGGNGIRVADVTDALVSDNLLSNSYAAGFLKAGTNTGLIVRGNHGYNPVGAVGSPSFPASTVALVNPFGIDAQVFLYGGSITEIKIGANVAGYATSYPFILPAGESITVTYTGSPGWNWTLN